MHLQQRRRLQLDTYDDQAQVYGTYDATEAVAQSFARLELDVNICHKIYKRDAETKLPVATFRKRKNNVNRQNTFPTEHWRF